MAGPRKTALWPGLMGPGVGTGLRGAQGISTATLAHLRLRAHGLGSWGSRGGWLPKEPQWLVAGKEQS